MSERNKFLSWYKREQSKGMIGFHPSFDLESIAENQPSSEEVFAELNEMVNSPNLRSDSDVPL